jgi:hypothetical protein
MALQMLPKFNLNMVDLSGAAMFTEVCAMSDNEEDVEVMELEEMHPRAQEAGDMILHLIGEVARLGILLAEIPEDQLEPVLGRYGAFIEIVDGLPIKMEKPHWGNNPAGEA